tara:strand:- start:796 stop:3303 length:2508 start_codon:yes stop_codon:yes gene_type:complete
MATSNNNVIVSRIQNRRGLKQDLPNPLRPGEMGLATDSKQVYIGSDPTIDRENSKFLSIENHNQAKTQTVSIPHNQIIKFTVPHIRYSAGTFTGTEKTISYTPSTSKTYTLPNSSSDTRQTFANTVVDGKFINLISNLAFTANTITVSKNGEVLTGDDTADASTLVANDYFFSSNTALANTHTVTLRNFLTSTDEVAITYYSNTAVIQALEGFNSANNRITFHSASQNFYDQYSIPDYRKIDEKYIRVSPTTGVGQIGLEYKHISIVADSTANISFATLGNLLTSNANSVVAGVTFAPAGASTVNVAVSNTGEKFNASSYFNYVYCEGIANSWANDKAIPLVSSNTSAISFTLPSGNTWQTNRPVTAAVSSGGTTTITGNVDGVVIGHTVRFIGGGAGQFDANSNKTYEVQTVGTNTFTVTEGSVSSEVENNLDYLNYGTDASGTNVQIFSALHGVPSGGQFKLAGSTATGQVANGNATLIGTATDNTFFMAAAGAGTSNVSGTASVVFGSDTSGNITPVRSTDLSSFVTLTEASAHVNNKSDADAWENLALVPGSSNRIYITSKASKTSAPFDFRLHNDTADTLGTLQLLDNDYVYGSKLYDRNTTVKAKLENWLDEKLMDTEINLLESVATNQKYATPQPGNIESYSVTIGSENDDIEFTSKEEAEDFAYITNNLYFGTVIEPLKQGLVTTKLNIELLTSQASAAGQATTDFTTTNVATIETSGNIIQQGVPFTIDATTFDTHVLEYTVKYDGTTDGNYRRVGTLLLNAYENATTGRSNVILQDVATDLKDVVTGNLEFSASYDDTTNKISLSTTNTTTLELDMKFIQRRWVS